MEIVVWLREGVWEAAVDAAVRLWDADTRFTLLHVMSSDEADVLRGGPGGLMGRHHRSSRQLQDVAVDADRELLAAAAARLGRPAELRTLTGRIERDVVVAAGHADLLVVSRDGDRRTLGPHSLGHATRFVVDHAACPVLLVWPEDPPPLDARPLR